MTASPVSEDELHAYLDGQLDSHRQAEVRAFLESSPAATTRLAVWRRDAEGLRAALAGIETWPPNPSLDPAVIRRRMRSHSWQTLVRAGVLSAALGLAGIVGWAARGAYVGPTPKPMQEAMEAHRVFAGLAVRAIEQRLGRELLPSWLARNLGGVHPVVPDLSSQGFKPVGARLLPTAEGLAAMILYEADSGARLTFYLRPARHFIPGTRGWRVDGGLRERYWYRGGYGYAVVGRADDPQITQVERAFPSAL